MTASSKLEGLTLTDNWFVARYIKPSPCSTGGTFSHSYLATRGSQEAFVKAFDFSQAFESGADTLNILTDLVASYEHERTVLEHCTRRKLRNVALAISHGQITVPGMTAMEGRVYYLLFETAIGDLRTQIDDAQALDAYHCILALQHACLGLRQLHRENIAHQDLKPSNVLHYSNNTFRVSDLGRCSRRGYQIWHDGHSIPGDRTYAPPELLYGYVHQDFVIRRFGADLYLLGNLAAFLFSGTNVTELLAAKLDPQYHWTKWNSDYHTILPYLQEAFGRVLEDLKQILPAYVRVEMCSLVCQLCNPSLANRGHPRGIGGFDQYSLERYVSFLDIVSKRIAFGNSRTMRIA